ncbi:MAG: SMC-Scp complex subunit ScpB [Candidatus Omnitrophica bacterium]|nr:SMC-Scp complex subunit ScpB [Candidatus Omnitrophota bacterium]
MSENKLKPLIEAILFSSDKPVLIEDIRNVLKDINPSEIRKIIEELKTDYLNQNRGIRIVELAGGFQMVTSEELSEELKKFYKTQKKERLSRAALETLAIIAYKQPITKLQIESLRGVEVEGLISKLKELGFIRIVGRRKAAGRPYLYGTSRYFLEYFGLNSLEDLSKLEGLDSKILNIEDSNIKQEETKYGDKSIA